jgi:hypothetical protein
MSVKITIFCPDHPHGTDRPCGACGTARRLAEQEHAKTLVGDLQVDDLVVVRKVRVVANGERVAGAIDQAVCEGDACALVDPEPSPFRSAASREIELLIELCDVPLAGPLRVEFDGNSVVVELGDRGPTLSSFDGHSARVPESEQQVYCGKHPNGSKLPCGACAAVRRAYFIATRPAVA